MKKINKLKADRDKFAGMLQQQVKSNNEGIINAHRLEGILAYLNTEIKEGKDA